LREAPDFRLLFLATLASSIGTWLAFVALVVDVFDRTGSAAWVSALLIVEFLPIVVVGLFAGPLIDRLPRKRLLVAADLSRAAVFCALPFAGSALGIVLLAAVAGVATSVFRPTVYAGLPNVVDDARLPQANGLLNTAESVTWAVGSVAGGAFVAAAGPDLGYWINAVTFVVSAVLVWSIRARLEEGGARGEREGHWRELAEGYRVVRGSQALMTVVVAWGLATFALAGINVAEVVLAKDVFDSGDLGYGVMVGATGVGLALGSLAGSTWVAQRGVRLPYAISIGLMAGSTAAAALAPNAWVAAACIVVSGFGNGIAVLCNALLVQRGAPDRLRGRVFTFVMSATYAVLGAGMIAAGPLTDVAGARALWVGAAAVLGAAAVASYAMLGGVAEHGEADEDALRAAATGSQV
jgi:MFS family permease